MILHNTSNQVQMMVNEGRKCYVSHQLFACFMNLKQSHFKRLDFFTLRWHEGQAVRANDGSDFCLLIIDDHIGDFVEMGLAIEKDFGKSRVCIVSILLHITDIL